MRIIRHELTITDYQTIPLPAAGDIGTNPKGTDL